MSNRLGEVVGGDHGGGVKVVLGTMMLSYNNNTNNNNHHHGVQVAILVKRSLHGVTTIEVVVALLPLFNELPHRVENEQHPLGPLVIVIKNQQKMMYKMVYDNSNNK